MNTVSPTTLHGTISSAPGEATPEPRRWTTPRLLRLDGAATNSGVFPMDTETCTNGTCYGPS